MPDPEALARIEIDRQLALAGWVVQDRDGMNVFAAEGVAIREVSLPGAGEADYLLVAGGKAKAAPALDTSTLPEVPEGWAWATIDELSVLVTDGDHNSPKRVDSGVPHLTAKNIRNWRTSFEGCTYISPQDFEKTRTRFEPTEGDLIVTCVGTVGETAIVPPGMLFSADRNLAGIRPVRPGLTSKWLQLVLNSPRWSALLRVLSGSTAQPHLYLGPLRSLPVSVPPETEQDRVIDEVERLMSVIEQLEATVEASLKRAEALRQSILRMAFSGRLVRREGGVRESLVLS